MDISNKALAMFLLAAIVVSLGGTIISLNRLGSVSTSGYATYQSGTVQLNVQGLLSITTADDNLLDFLTCTPLSGGAAIVNSELSGANNSVCTIATADNISVRNDGNIRANVTINSTKVGRASNATAPLANLFLNSSSAASSIAYKISSAGRLTNTGGCATGNFTAIYTNFTNYNSKYRACDNLTYGASANSFTTNIQFVLPYDAPQGAVSVTIYYDAHSGP
jgi:hypothetical protein